MSFRLTPLIKGTAPVIPLHRPVLLVGRHIECDVRLDSPKVSRRHCCVAMAYDRVLIRDLGSRNGVRVNGRVVNEARLRFGDELAIGPVLFRLEAEPVENRPSAVSNAARTRIRRRQRHHHSTPPAIAGRDRTFARRPRLQPRPPRRHLTRSCRSRKILGIKRIPRIAPLLARSSCRARLTESRSRRYDGRRSRTVRRRLRQLTPVLHIEGRDSN